MKKKYNSELFFGGLMINVIAKFPLLIIAVILGIIGIWKRPFLIAALCILAAVMLWAFIQQLMIKTMVEHNKDEDFAPFADAMKSENWQEELTRAADEAKIVDIDIDKPDEDEYND